MLKEINQSMNVSKIIKKARKKNKKKQNIQLYTYDGKHSATTAHHAPRRQP
jgi:hypothetical protein